MSGTNHWNPTYPTAKAATPASRRPSGQRGDDRDDERREERPLPVAQRAVDERGRQGDGERDTGVRAAEEKGGRAGKEQEERERAPADVVAGVVRGDPYRGRELHRQHHQGEPGVDPLYGGETQTGTRSLRCAPRRRHPPTVRV